MVTHYRELVAWGKAMDLVTEIYRLTQEFPECERFGLTNQIRRAAVSVPSNIAEGQGRQLQKAFSQHLRIARGSLQELETQLLIASRLGFVTPEHLRPVLALTDEVSRIISGLLRSLKVKR